MMEDVGCKVDVCIRTDASAAKGMASRAGLGEVRHLEVSQLWLQEKVAKGLTKVRKVQGGENLADGLTKGGVDRDLLWKASERGTYESSQPSLKHSAADRKD